MIYLFGVIFSTLLVLGNSLYKLAVDAAGFEISSDFLLSKKMVAFLFSWQLVGGVTAFVAATGVSFWMLTKYEFSAIQAVSVPVVMGLSFVVGSFVFHEENLSLLNYAGLAVIVVGVILAAQR